MQVTPTQKKAIDHYYQELAAYLEKKVTHETAVRSAFQNLLATFAQSANWVLIPEQTLANGKRPDGTMRDSFNLPRGYWEAKDSRDDLHSEIRKKISAGYPITNTIFEDTRRAILYQNNKLALDIDLTNAKELITVLDSFFHYAAPDIATFEHAVADFKESIPDLAQGLVQRIQEEHAHNKTFVVAFTSFLCASVEEVLQREFGTSIAEPGVQILDPCVGTGSFIVNFLHRIPRHKLKHKYLHDLFCNEIMLLPYYIASLNIEHEYYERTGEYLPYEGICFADTLELAEGQQLSMFVEQNTERIQREKDTPIMVVIGNPPYNAWQKSENDNNKNRLYQLIDHRIRETYAKSSKATLKNALYDAYIKFFRWATDRLEGHDGIVCFVSNNGFITGSAFDGFRKQLAGDFTQIFHLDLGGNARKQGGGNVFGIMVGVGITVLVRHRVERNVSNQSAAIFYHKIADDQKGVSKLAFLTAKASIAKVEWQELHPDERNTWLTEGLNSDFATFLPIGIKEAKISPNLGTSTIFRMYSGGVKTNRDLWVYDFDRNVLVTKIKRFIETYNGELDRWRRRSSSSIIIDDFVIYDDKRIKWSGDLKNQLKRGRYVAFLEKNIRQCLYHPFVKKYLYFDPLLNDRRLLQHLFFPTIDAEVGNAMIIASDLGHRTPFSAFATNIIPELHLLATTDAFQCFPYYTYSEDGSNRRENITDWSLAQFQSKYGSDVTKWNIFHYVYAMLHHPQYRERYAENLKRDLPHIPLLHNQAAFQTCVRIGQQLMDLHQNYEQAREYPLKWIENQDVPFSWQVKRMRLTADRTAVTINESLTLAGIPPECFAYRLGNRSALDWIIDQYQLSEDKRSGIISDPNRPDDEEYIVRLLGKVITVSVETVKLVQELARDVQQEEWVNAEM